MQHSLTLNSPLVSLFGPPTIPYHTTRTRTFIAFVNYFLTFLASSYHHRFEGLTLSGTNNRGSKGMYIFSRARIPATIDETKEENTESKIARQISSFRNEIFLQ